MFEMVGQLPFTRCGADGKLKLHEAVKMMMDCCQFQEYQESGLSSYLRENNIAVFLSSIQIDILRMPGFRENVTTAVKIYDCKSIYGLRRITMRDENGNLCLISNATGAFFDIAAGKAIKVDPAVFGVKFDEAEEMECLPRKIPASSAPGESSQGFQVKNSDLDPNGHMTSPNYFAIATDALGESYSFDRVRVEYKQQAKAGNFVLPVIYRESDRVVVEMKSGGGLPFAMAEFSRRSQDGSGE